MNATSALATMTMDELTDSIDHLVDQRRVGSSRYVAAELQALMNELHQRAAKINPRGIVTQIAAGPDGIRTRIITT